MNLQLQRHTFTDKSTIGSLYVDGVFECYTLEDVVRPEGVKIKGETAIPYDEYEVIIDFSNRFQKPMPHVMNVPMFDGIRIHPGNSDVDTEGCILLGKSKSVDFIGNSREAFGAFFPKLQSGLTRGKVMLDISGQKPQVA